MVHTTYNSHSKLENMDEEGSEKLILGLDNKGSITSVHLD